MSLASKLQELKSAQDQGLMSESEYQNAKQSALNNLIGGVGSGLNGGGGGGAIVTASVVEPNVEMTSVVTEQPRYLPPFWKEVSDPSSEKPYYWNEVTNETVWERPQGGQRGHGGEQKVESLPPGWRVVVHEGTGQKLYEHESTKERRWTAPTSENDGYDMLHSAATEKPSIKFSLGGALGGKRKKGTSSSSSRGSNDGGSSSTGTDSESKKKYKFNNKVDPLDFEGGTGGKLGGGPESAGKMADSTATGALYQQRPYPAPGTRHKNKN